MLGDSAMAKPTRTLRVGCESLAGHTPARRFAPVTLEEKTSGAFPAVHLHDSAFPERWTEVDDSGIQPTASKD
jgi:hypothetical protein